MSVTALIVDDSPIARQVIGRYLRESGCTIVGEAGSATEAPELFRESKPAVVTLDLVMTHLESIESLELLRIMKAERPDMVSIIMSEGVFDYVVKPFNDYALEAIKLKVRRAFPELSAR